MVSTAVNWFWIGLSAFLWGMAIVHLLNKHDRYHKKEWDVICCMGLCGLTAYAQFFSLFYKVGFLANAVLLAVDILIAFWLRIELLQEIRKLKENVRYLVLFAVAAFVVMIFTTQPIQHYDTFLYHAQSIRWIEEYGVVKGLGNLHNRLAYNSSIFSLEALFSLKFLLGRSMHAVNGFVMALFLGYTLCSLKAFRKGRIYASDFLRLAMIFFIGYSDNLSVISSSGSDLTAIGLVIYILIKWVSYQEEKEEAVAPYAYLCVMAVFAVTVKLSAAMIVLLAIAPAVRLVKGKKWKAIAAYFGAGLAVTLPFLTRNVFISGYLIYPYPEIDLFNVDWKMPSYTLLFDRNEIKTWGWGLQDVSLFDTPVWEWFPTWYEGIGFIMQVLFWIDIALALLSIGIAVYQMVRQGKTAFPLIVFTLIACFLMWFVNSPLIRYGSAYMVLLPAYVCGSWLAGKAWNRKMLRLGMSVLLLLVLLPIGKGFLKSDFSYELLCPDYEWYIDTEEVQLEGKSIYLPIGSDQAGYYPFPSTPYEARLALIELRGEELSDGFRMKEEYRDAFVSTYGQVYEENMFAE